jgi:hypothetical protein
MERRSALWGRGGGRLAVIAVLAGLMALAGAASWADHLAR